MKIVRLNGNDIKKLVQKILKEDAEWFEETLHNVDLIGTYYSKPKLVIGKNRIKNIQGELLKVFNIDGSQVNVGEITVNGTYHESITSNRQLIRIITNELNHNISKGTLLNMKTPHKQMDVEDILKRIESGDLVKFDGGLIEESNVILKEDTEWFEDVPEYDLLGVYYRKPVQKMSGISGGQIVDVVSIKDDEVVVIVAPLTPIMNPHTFEPTIEINDKILKHEIQHYLFHKTAQGLLKSFSNKNEVYTWTVNDLIEDIESGDLIKYDMNLIKESRLFGEPKKTPDERIAEHLFDKIQKERPDIQHQFIGNEKNVSEFYGITTNRGVLEADYFRVDFSNKSTRISKNNNGIMQGGDFGIIKVYNPIYRNDLGKKTNVIGYALKLTDENITLGIPRSLVKKIYELVEEQYGDIRTFKTQRKIDTGSDDESDLFDQLG